MPTIHPTASVSAECELAADVVVGPYCTITGRVKLGAGVRLMGHVYVQGPATIGARTVVFPFTCLGFDPQDHKFDGTTAGISIGEDCRIREHATVHASTMAEAPTRVGNRVLLMVNTHVAHDCVIGDRVVMVNGSGIAGHGLIESDVTLGGNAVIHQFCRIGRMAMMSGDCAVNLDVPPFCIVSERNRIGGINVVGLRRNNVPREQITVMRRAFADLLHRPMPRERVVASLRERGEACPPLLEMAEFIEQSKRGICPGMGKPMRGTTGANERESVEALAED